MQAGELIGQRYQLTKQLQTAWQAIDQASGQLCVLKPESSFIDPAVAIWLGQTWHAGLPRLLNQITGPKLENYFVFEYLAGQPISSLPDQRNGCLPLSRLLPLMIQASRILAFLHHLDGQMVLHLDIKTDHLIVNDDGELSLIDFGAARMIDVNPAVIAAGPDKSPAALTPGYAAPEQLAGHPAPGSDIFALGVVMLNLLTGVPPAMCRSQPLRDLLPDYQGGMQRLISRCLHADSALRYANADELTCDLIREKTSGLLELNQAANLSNECSFDTADTGLLHAPLLCIWDGADFGCELAAVYAKQRHVLVIDADLLNPRIDFLLGIKQGVNFLSNQKRMHGLDLVLTEEQGGHLDAALLGRLLQATPIDQVSALTNQLSLDHYEHYHLDSFNQVLHLARLVCDLVIVLCSRFIFDAFTCLSLAAADRILVPLSGDSCSFREYNRAIDFFFSRHKVDHQKLRFVAFCYRQNADLSWGTLDELSGGRLIGCISDSDKRRKMKSGAVPYAAALDRINKQEYQNIIKRIRLPKMEKR